MQAQIKDQLSLCHSQILEKLDMNVSDEDRVKLKEMQRNTEQFQRESAVYLNLNTEMGYELN